MLLTTSKMAGTNSSRIIPSKAELEWQADEMRRLEELKKIKHEAPTTNGANAGSIVIPQSESIEVTRNTKGYNYSVKILSTDLDRLKVITDKLETMYPNA